MVMPDGVACFLVVNRSGRGPACAVVRALAEAELPAPGETLRLLYTPAWNGWNEERRVQSVVDRR